MNPHRRFCIRGKITAWKKWVNGKRTIEHHAVKVTLVCDKRATVMVADDGKLIIGNNRAQYDTSTDLAGLHEWCDTCHLELLHAAGVLSKAEIRFVLRMRKKKDDEREDARSRENLLRLVELHGGIEKVVKMCGA